MPYHGGLNLIRCAPSEPSVLALFAFCAFAVEIPLLLPPPTKKPPGKPEGSIREKCAFLEAVAYCEIKSYTIKKIQRPVADIIAGSIINMTTIITSIIKVFP